MRIRRLFLLFLCLTTSALWACSSQVEPSPPRPGQRAFEDTQSLNSNDATSATEDSFVRRSATNNLTKGDTNVALTAKSACGFDTDNPYPCCVNSPGQYGNCTGAAWQQMKAGGWGDGLPRASWGDARNWRAAALAEGYLVDSNPTLKSVGVANGGPTLKNHVAFVTGVTGSQVTTVDQQCGYLLSGGYFTTTRAASAFNDGYIRAPIPEAIILLWSGAESATNATLTVTRGSFNSPVTVNFGFSRLRANVNTATKGRTVFRWSIGGKVVSYAGTFSQPFTASGSYPVSVTVTNGMNVSTTANATVVIR